MVGKDADKSIAPMVIAEYANASSASPAVAFDIKNTFNGQFEQSIFLGGDDELVLIKVCYIQPRNSFHGKVTSFFCTYAAG